MCAPDYFTGSNGVSDRVHINTVTAASAYRQRAATRALATAEAYLERVGLAVHKEQGGEGLESLGAVLQGRPYRVGPDPIKRMA